MMNGFKKIFLAGELPYFAALVFMATGFYVGQEFRPEGPKVAIAERGAVILEAVLERHGATEEVLQREVSKPVLEVLQRYADLGYVVFDSSKDEAGNYAVAALPSAAIDITEALKQAVKKPRIEGPALSEVQKPESKQP
jgi:hypothetical protein